MFYHKKHFYLSDYCKYLLYGKECSKVQDTMKLRYLQEDLSDKVIRYNIDENKSIDENKYPDEVIRRLWLKTQKDLKLKNWEIKYADDNVSYLTGDTACGMIYTYQQAIQSLNVTINELEAKNLILEKEKREYEIKIAQLEDENNKLKRDDNSIKRKKLN